ncbi:MAG: glycine C-acetyltransferase [Nitrospirae bacterium RIFCSPLOW2_12_42_9]|nr:MAG: glycine C-acetyltransferase [Nitrospirae bacterium RIFCSPHIGHO2_02_FULL_42_12]OGW57664.1 MAG: glycine C-acetyltransferase [Nitrospirae bacterium RIFCSPLOW2_12_42_9]HBI22752.1 glycine C-acetyltransferase [Nitrospiraceae bacterium]
MYSNLKSYLQEEFRIIKEKDLYKEERLLSSPQGVSINVQGKKVINMCANNYLGLSNHPSVIAAAKVGLEKWGYGMSSVRFICGTQDIHKELEKRLSSFLSIEDTLLYTSCFDANTGLFETLFSEEDAILSDELNHASIIDGIRLCKARRFRFRHMDMNDLEEKLKETGTARFRIIATDGVFSMDGDVAPLTEICLLAEKYDSLVMVDDSHATGFFGPSGRGSIEYCGVMGKVDIVTSTIGKAMGGAAGGFTSSYSEIITMLRQRSRPYLFSNSLPPVIVSTAIKVMNILEGSQELRHRLMENTAYFRKEISGMGFNIREGIHPIVPVMLGKATLAVDMAAAIFNEGVYVVGFSYPVVPEGKARIRVQLSAAHERSDLDFVLDKFRKVGKNLRVI